MDSWIRGPISGYIGEVAIVQDVSLPVSPGAITAIFAPSGAGKTSLLRMIAGLWEGRISGLNIEPGLRVSYVAQRDFLFPWMTLARNLEFPAKFISSSPRSQNEKLESLSDLFKIRGLLNRFPYQVSGGELQRALIVRGLAAGANLLLLDEPMNSLDVASRVALRQSLRSAVTMGNVALVLVTHDLPDAISVADTICLFSGPPLRTHMFLRRVSQTSFNDELKTRNLEETRLLIENEFAKMALNGEEYCSSNPKSAV